MSKRMSRYSGAGCAADAFVNTGAQLCLNCFLPTGAQLCLNCFLHTGAQLCLNCFTLSARFCDPAYPYIDIGNTVPSGIVHNPCLRQIKNPLEGADCFRCGRAVNSIH